MINGQSPWRLFSSSSQCTAFCGSLRLRLPRRTSRCYIGLGGARLLIAISIHSISLPSYFPSSWKMLVRLGENLLSNHSYNIPPKSFWGPPSYSVSKCEQSWHPRGPLVLGISLTTFSELNVEQPPRPQVGRNYLLTRWPPVTIFFRTWGYISAYRVCG